MVHTQCSLCGKILTDKDSQSEGQVIQKHQQADPDCKANPVAAGNSLDEAIRKARGV